MKLKVFYNENQSVKDNPSFSPSAGKPALVAELFSQNPKVSIESNFLPLTRDQIKICHDHQFVDDILDCKKSNGFENKLPSIAQSLLWNNASFYNAAKYALENKTVAMSPTSGFHHAEFNVANGFCTFNGLMITAMLLKKEYDLKCIAIVDFDAHWGNGTDQIIQQFGIKWIKHFSFGREADFIKNRGFTFNQWLEQQKSILYKSFIGTDLSQTRVDMILYQAGADPHIDDPYGGFLTTEQMRMRDEIVFDWAHFLNIPIVWNLAGGYQTPVQKVLDLHTNTLNECLKVYFK